MRSSITINNVFSVRANLDDKIPFRGSIGFNSAQGVVKTDNYERLTASFKVTPSFFDDNLKVDTNAKSLL